MTKSFTPKLKGKASKSYGIGMKFLQGQLTIEPSVEALHCSDIDLRAIYGVYVEQNRIGTYIVTKVSALGSMNNYASFIAYNLATAGAAAALTGTFTANVLIIGE